MSFIVLGSDGIDENWASLIQVYFHCLPEGSRPSFKIQTMKKVDKMNEYITTLDMGSLLALLGWRKEATLVTLLNKSLVLLGLSLISDLSSAAANIQ